jgi:hypothetical protein
MRVSAFQRFSFVALWPSALTEQGLLQQKPEETMVPTLCADWITDVC